MPSDTSLLIPAGPALPYVLAIQRSRAGSYGVSLVMALLFIRLGVLHISVAQIFGIFLAGLATVVAFYLLARNAPAFYRRNHLDLVWLLGDVALVSWATSASGGFTSPWYIWYMSNAAAAAFLEGRRGALLISTANSLAYFGMLLARGEIHFFDENLYVALARMAFIHGASFFFLRGVADLQEKRRLIKILKQEETRKVEELTRLTTALDQRTRELHEANQRIRAADRMKSRFLANMSHELRTPLNSIIGFSEILESRLGETISDRHRRFLQNIETSGRHLLAVINDILDLSKIEAGQLRLTPEAIDVRATAEALVQTMHGIIEPKQVAVAVEIPADLGPVEADPLKFKQILYNLLSNAVKFSPPGETVVLRAAHASAASSPLGVDSVRLDVVDRGPGIASDQQELVFEEFRQAAGGSGSREGTGLGLALVRSLLTLHRGSISLESAPGRGSTFSAFLPLRFAGDDPRELPLVSEDASLSSDGQPRVLVVEDDPLTFESIRLALEGASYLPLQARTGEEALEMARTLRPAAITLDLVLPGIDGWDVLKSLKADVETRDIPVIIVSMIAGRELGLALGADDYLVKPLERDALIRRLDELVPSAGAPATLLVIDDDQQIHDMLEAFLSPSGYRLEHAYSGAEGLSRAAREPRPALVILDLMMTGMDGFEVAIRLKEDPLTASLPVLILTSQELTLAEKEKLRGKIAGLMQKADSVSGRLTPVIAELLRRHRAGAAARD
ncbi:MAG: response regulator [Thermoanaerobaculia bacterium]